MKFLSKGELEQKHRLIILTDMENEPDDSQTMVKLLMYSNEIDIEGLIAVTSRWLQHSVYPESIYDRVKAYGVVRSNLQKHATGWPTEDYLLERVAGGQRGYGMEVVGSGKNTLGSDLIIRVLEADDDRPVHFAINAGANTLAQALFDIRETRPEEELERLVAKIRVYDDAGQDNSGAWICHEFPNIFYVRSRAQVFGLFGPDFSGGGDNGPTPWAPLDQYDWAEAHIRTRHGVLGALYPQRMFKGGKFEFMDGGGTTTWLGLVNKGLYDPKEISWGGWGGRFSWEKKELYSFIRDLAPLEEPYSPFAMFPEEDDWSWSFETDKKFEEFSGLTGMTYTNETFYPLWRWRDAYTHDFQARMDWCVCDYGHANHHPIAAFYDDRNRTIVRLSATAGEELILDASQSWDPDMTVNRGDPRLNFLWGPYPEAGTYTGDIKVSDNDKDKAKFVVPSDASGKQIHIVLSVTDSHLEVPLTSYRRIVINVE